MVEQKTSNEVTPAQVAHRLKLVLDPEVGLNIVDLGLIYGIDCRDAHVTVTVTMTSMGCPMTHFIRMSIENVLSKMPNVQKGDIELVWTPAWSMEMINPDVMRRRRVRPPRY